ncbi:MAG: SAM-dependent methyltransferase [Lachnospiraceae bacterium]|jgi:16S rRNA C967 or C1407 C5-methylase (RsmB/RsmF family)/NOL1/NOP2/fmu family ribosome biogenesis protein|nr:SAM-dependent methyltransferase [Lachnospiraceae bacterium]
MRLPETFLAEMRQMLGSEYEAWLGCYREPSRSGLRVNTAKLLPKQWEKISPYGTRRVPWTANGYYVEGDRRPARDSYYYAGLYYLQEPSAMAPAAVLPVEPGNRVLDLCAAPGGKSTELGARLKGKGLLVSNDISSSRAKALLKNLELAGIGNVCVTSESPGKLAQVLGPFFHRILVDAPCSGEGMFRRDPELVKSWEEHGPEYYVPLQREILSRAVEMLLPGGYLLYSTCTFSVRENEENVRWLLDRYPVLEPVPVPLWEGAKGGVDASPAVRLFPHRVEGEGHFLALLRMKEQAWDREIPQDLENNGDKGERGSRSRHLRQPGQKAEAGWDVSRQEGKLLDVSDFASWESQVRTSWDRDRIMVKNGQVYVLPEDFRREWNLRYLRTGLLLGELKKGRFEPSQAVAMTLGPEDYRQVFSMDHEDERVVRYLKGETLSLVPEEISGLASGKPGSGGWILVCVDQYPLGWARLAGTNLKNKYHPGWRWQ